MNLCSFKITSFFCGVYLFFLSSLFYLYFTLFSSSNECRTMFFCSHYKRCTKKELPFLWDQTFQFIHESCSLTKHNINITITTTSTMQQTYVSLKTKQITDFRQSFFFTFICFLFNAQLRLF